jgi:ribosomal-protein-serine acetyltransferase
MNPLLLDFPDRFETERLTIRSPRPGDGAELNAAIRDSKAALEKWMPWAAGEIPTVEESEANVRRAYTQFLLREDLRLSLFLKGSDTMVGSSGLHRIDWSVPCMEIGYWVRTPYSGRGYITEAVRAVSRFAFEELGAKRVEIRCDALNEKSAAVARRAGFPLEATLHNQARDHGSGRLRDTLIFALTQPDDP